MVSARLSVVLAGLSAAGRPGGVSWADWAKCGWREI